MSTPLDTKGGIGPCEGPDSAGASEERTADWSFDAPLASPSIKACFDEPGAVSATTDLTFDAATIGF